MLQTRLDYFRYCQSPNNPDIMFLCATSGYHKNALFKVDKVTENGMILLEIF